MPRKLSFILMLSLISCLNGCGSFIAATSDEPMQEDYGERTWGSFIDDDSIETKAYVNLKKASPKLDEAHISVISYNGIVLIVGQVPDQHSKTLATKTVQRIRKVRRVHNELIVAGESGTLVRSGDAWLTTKTKMRMWFTPELQSGRIKVITENGVVYLMGLVSRAEADRVVSEVQHSYGVQKIVKIFEYIDDGRVY